MSKENGKSRKRDLVLRVLNRADDNSNNDIGSGWIDSQGFISVRLRPFVHLEGHKDLILTLWPETDEVKDKLKKISIKQQNLLDTEVRFLPDAEVPF